MRRSAIFGVLAVLAAPGLAQTPREPPFGLNGPAPPRGAHPPAVPKGADNSDPSETKDEARPSRRATLDDLFARLAAAKDEEEAKGVANLIQRRWSRSGSDTADLLAARAQEAIQKKDHALAVELLDRVITLRPGWAEAWNLRASTFYLLEDVASAMADLRQTLAREPRHFAAIAGLGHIYMASGDKKRALEAYRRALAIHPYLDSVKKVVDRVEHEVDGRDI